ncbi:hypothetical protein Cgig2_003085 [Carnegiea gigantea]|uniref:THH1/TOM1/TOM3 domain-containing protein n=1 Tax=Carnegiea gigantea TaxID=171969 RepID=A0A9Q1KES4_9CARY|nr:hypothetical protein Cgig2_003085 [Carnegiea gigantea]
MAETLDSSTATAAVAAYVLRDAYSWWDDINESRLWQDRIFHVLAILYGIVSAVALIQLARIQLRVPAYGWTTQKVFHFLNFLVNGVRCLVFVFRRDVRYLQPEIVQHILLDMPSLAFFTTYALLVLFWAEIYYQAQGVSTDGLRPCFYAINAVVYAIQVKFCLSSRTDLGNKLSFLSSLKYCVLTIKVSRPLIMPLLICLTDIHFCIVFLYKLLIYFKSCALYANWGGGGANGKEKNSLYANKREGRVVNGKEKNSCLDCFVADLVVEAGLCCGNPVKDAFCSCVFGCSLGLSSLWRKVIS